MTERRSSLLFPVLVAAVLATLVAAAVLLVPDRESGGGGAYTPSTESSRGITRTGPGAVTDEARAEIDRVMAAGRSAPVAARVDSAATARTAAQSQIRCVEFEGQRYCLGIGWTTRTEAEAQQETITAARAALRMERSGRESTGGLDAAAMLQARAALTPAQRTRQERAELTQAARSVAKIWLLRHEIQGVPLPRGFWSRHPEAAGLTVPAEGGAAGRLQPGETEPPVTDTDHYDPGATDPGDSSTPSPTSSPSAKSRPKEQTQPKDQPAGKSKSMADYPDVMRVLNRKQVSEQETTYWCGPTAMQMLAWGWTDERESQSTWAKRLGTTTSGTAITEMVRVVNDYTGWDRPGYAGPYIALDISDWSFEEWALLQARHYEDYRAPVVLHPVLLKQYFPYLDDDASGHFQVGRGYSQRGKKYDRIGYFEPWNQQRFDPSEPVINRVQWRSAYRSYRANQAHFQHNIGV